MSEKIPATVITGFLGAGKTSMIRHLLANANGKRIALVINEFGDIGVDGEILKGCGIEGCEEDDVLELANGCICCTVADDFLPTIEKILARPERPDHIVIETSGLALPKPLVKAFNWPDVRTHVTVDGVVTVVDAPAVAAGAGAPRRGARLLRLLGRLVTASVRALTVTVAAVLFSLFTLRRTPCTEYIISPKTSSCLCTRVV